MTSLPARCLLTYLLSAAAGYVCFRIGAPLPWMVGAVAASAAMSLAGLPVVAWAWGRRLGMITVGTALGLYFTPEALHQVADNLVWILLAIVSTVLISCLASLLLARTAGIDRATAFLCSVPGGVAEMCILAQRYGALQTPVAVAQLLRVISLVALLPSALLLLGADATPRVTSWSHAGPGLFLLLGGSGLITFLCARAGMVNAWLLLPLALSIIASISGLQTELMPAPLTSVAQVLIGTQLGCSFKRKDVLAVRQALPAILLNLVVIAGGCAVVGTVIALASGNELATLILATAPGGVTEMSLTAKSMGLNVPLVVGFHVLRVFIVLTATPYLFTMLRRLGVITQQAGARSVMPPY